MKSVTAEHLLREYLSPTALVIIFGSVAKNLAFLQNQWIPSQLGDLINIITDKIAHKGKNCSLKLRKYYFCTRTIYEHLDR